MWLNSQLLCSNIIELWPKKVQSLFFNHEIKNFIIGTVLFCVSDCVKLWGIQTIYCSQKLSIEDIFWTTNDNFYTTFYSGNCLELEGAVDLITVQRSTVRRILRVRLSQICITPFFYANSTCTTVCNFKTVCGCVKNWIKYLRRRLINLLKKVNKGIWMEARGASARVSHHSVGVSLDL